MTDALGPQDGAGTPLSDEEREGLIPSYITLRGELNEAEQVNILEAEEWAFARKRDILREDVLGRRTSTTSARCSPSSARKYGSGAPRRSPSRGGQHP